MPTRWRHWAKEFKRLQDGGFAEWRLSVDGMVARPLSLSLSEIQSLPVKARSRIWRAKRAGRISLSGPACLFLMCWDGRRSPQARYVVYRSIQPDWWESIDMADAMHPQTLVAHGMNGANVARRIRWTSSHARAAAAWL